MQKNEVNGAHLFVVLLVAVIFVAGLFGVLIYFNGLSGNGSSEISSALSSVWKDIFFFTILRHDIQRKIFAGSYPLLEKPIKNFIVDIF